MPPPPPPPPLRGDDFRRVVDLPDFDALALRGFCVDFVLGRGFDAAPRVELLPDPFGYRWSATSDGFRPVEFVMFSPARPLF